ncbi:MULTISPECIES: hypothetical protein [unclassified Nostoc]|uniref:hypothetical protein n=1 Tax=unclassified Nostoc TaxID=2593658 RepID=UPI002AD4A0F4|nr:hypothetical protein [Nostoc sp. DedQUE03]MDZ7975755.1 hypothetical protein [Nostoc sp. DedQUE03]MDZ8048287.1 hypothetical protein [Nostoc sp. DedQUE02]
MSIASDNNLLWVPSDIGDLLTVSVDGLADDSTAQGMLVINGAASQWLSGAMDDCTYFELLDHYGIDPFGFVGEVEEHMQLLMR